MAAWEECIRGEGPAGISSAGAVSAVGQERRPAGARVRSMPRANKGIRGAGESRVHVAPRALRAVDRVFGGAVEAADAPGVEAADEVVGDGLAHGDEGCEGRKGEGRDGEGRLITTRCRRCPPSTRRGSTLRTCQPSARSGARSGCSATGCSLRTSRSSNRVRTSSVDMARGSGGAAPEEDVPGSGLAEGGERRGAASGALAGRASPRR